MTGQGVNVHHERQSQIEAARQHLMVERTVLQAKIDALDSSLEMGGISREAVYYEALGALKPEDNSEMLDWRSFKIAEQEQMAEREAIRQYASLLMGEYVRLMVNRSELLDEYGEGPPAAELRVEAQGRGQTPAERTAIPGHAGHVHLMDESAQEQEKDYVEIYMQMLRDQLSIYDKQIKTAGRRVPGRTETGQCHAGLSAAGPGLPE